MDATDYALQRMDDDGCPPSPFVLILWHCLSATGPPEWCGTEIYEPPECDEEFYTVEFFDEFYDGETGLSVVCPKCGDVLDNTYDSPEDVTT